MMNKEQLIDKLERVVCGQYSYEMQELAYSALCCIKGTWTTALSSLLRVRCLTP